MSEAYARNTDPVESHVAARRARTAKLEQTVLKGLELFGPRSTKELADLANMPRDSFSPRMRPLERQGLVRKTDIRRDGAAVWELL